MLSLLNAELDWGIAMYKTLFFCINCNEELTYKQKMYSYGRCPKCGFKDKNAATIVQTYEKAYKENSNPTTQKTTADKTSKCHCSIIAFLASLIAVLVFVLNKI